MVPADAPFASDIDASGGILKASNGLGDLVAGRDERRPEDAAWHGHRARHYIVLSNWQGFVDQLVRAHPLRLIVRSAQLAQLLEPGQVLLVTHSGRGAARRTRLRRAESR